MFKKIFEYAGPYKKNMYVATVVVLVSVLMGVLPFVLAYQVISPLVMGDSVETEFVLLRVIGVLICLVLQAVLYGWGLSISHKAAYNTLFRLRVSLQEKFEKLPLGIVEEKGTGTIKKLFVDDVDSLELLLAHSVPEGIANFTDPAGDLCCYVLCGLETGSYVFGLYPDQPALHGHYVLCWNEAHGSLLSVCTENEQHDH